MTGIIKLRILAVRALASNIILSAAKDVEPVKIKTLHPSKLQVSLLNPQSDNNTESCIYL